MPELPDIDLYVGSLAERVDGATLDALRIAKPFLLRSVEPAPDEARGNPVQRIRCQRNETNYCARCRAGGRIYADRARSRLLKDDWPRELEP